MAELILTEEEKAAHSWLDLDDASLGKVVKNLGVKLHEESSEFGRITTVTAAMLLLSMAVDTNATEASIGVNGLTKSGKDAGDWEVKVTRVRAPAKSDEEAPNAT